MSFILGLTGPTGAGKSTISKKAEEKGFYIIDCDKTARKAAENPDCLKALALNFGKDILNESGQLVRPLLAERAFSSKEKTKLLNETIFPFINKLLSDEIGSAKAEKILLDAPTLYESGNDILCDVVIAVLADEETRLKRITERDNLDETSAKTRILAGKPNCFYEEKTPYVIYNNGDKKQLIEDFQNLLKEIIGG